MPRKLTNEELRDLKEWLLELEVFYKNINRDFSDALPVANLLKKLYPKLVELNNYPARNKTELKQINWETLNQKVLIKLGLKQHKKVLEKLAKGEPGAMEALLFDIMLMDRAEKSKNEVCDEQEQLWTENDEVLTVTVNKKIGDALVQVPQKMILYSIYEQAQRVAQIKDNVIQTAEEKIRHLEDVLKLKSERIDELCSQLEKTFTRRALSDHHVHISDCETSFTKIKTTPMLE